MGGGHVTSNQKVLCTFQKIHSGVVWIFQQFLYTPKDALNHEFLSKILGNSASGTPLADSAELPPPHLQSGAHGSASFSRLPDNTPSPVDRQLGAGAALLGIPCPPAAETLQACPVTTQSPSCLGPPASPRLGWGGLAGPLLKRPAFPATQLQPEDDCRVLDLRGGELTITP